MRDPQRQQPFGTKPLNGEHLLRTGLHKAYLASRLPCPAGRVLRKNLPEHVKSAADVMKFRKNFKQRGCIHVGGQELKQAKRLSTLRCKCLTSHNIMTFTSPDKVIEPPEVAIRILNIITA